MKLLGMYKFTEFWALVSLRSLQRKHETDYYHLLHIWKLYSIEKKSNNLSCINVMFFWFSNTADNVPIFTDLNINICPISDQLNIINLLLNVTGKKVKEFFF